MSAILEQHNGILEQFKHPDLELSIEDILVLLPWTRRTLQRRLSELIKNGKLKKVGQGRSSRYSLVSVVVLAKHTDIRAYLRQSITQRTPVGYNRAFLEAYRPNETRYLSSAICQNLVNQGSHSLEKNDAGTYARQILNRLLIDLSWNSSRLEGNTYSLLETEKLITLGETTDEKAALDAQMILNHKAAIEFLVDSAEQIGFNNNTILNLHALLSDNLLGDPDACGRLRSITVGITGSVYYPLSIPQQIAEYFQQILATATAILDPLEQAFFVLVHLSYLQAFEDVNKRVARLAANIPLIKHNLCPLSFIDVDTQEYLEAILAIYELNDISLLQEVFVNAYQRSIQRYGAIKQSIQPDLFRLRYRTQLSNLVYTVINDKIMFTRLSKFIDAWSKSRIPTADQAHFKAIAVKELMSLHEGNIARHHVQLTAFLAWKAASQ